MQFTGSRGCNWTLVGPPGTILRLEIIRFTNEIDDYKNEVIIYDGPNAQSSDRDWTLNQDGNVGTIKSRGNSIHITLKSGTSKFDIGFEIHYSPIGSNSLTKNNSGVDQN